MTAQIFPSETIYIFLNFIYIHIFKDLNVMFDFKLNFSYHTEGIKTYDLITVFLVALIFNFAQLRSIGNWSKLMKPSNQ